MMLFKKITSLMFWGEFKTPQNHFLFLCATILKIFEQCFEKPNLEDAHSAIYAITGDQWTRFGGATPSSIIK
ncbi:hypothetical protein AB205_0075400 [Aquarana catesbeiana]|uniref:Uncharacterized protein n=1 Tax=Aquarana catesbeiana TaxID=8400 RepID=A0A2G9Q6B3_AQUCT|nr:hypothetical protein AB205_0075400 [Aquarana catesbeiana]